VAEELVVEVVEEGEGVGVIVEVEEVIEVIVSKGLIEIMMMMMMMTRRRKFF
jgi:hypothetical protein